MIRDLPDVTVEIAFDSNPSETPDWEDVTDYVQAISIRRGRSDALGKIEAGTCRFVLDNRDRRFDPSNDSGAYYPNVLPMRKLRVQAEWDSETYDLFTGYVERWPQKWAGVTKGYVEVTAVDGFEPLVIAEFDMEAPQELSGSRIDAVLDAIGWSEDDRNLDAGQSEVVAESLVTIPALQHIQDVADSERGYVFMSGDGKVTYHDRHRRISGSYVTSQATFGDDPPGELPYEDVTLEYDKDRIRNHITVSRQGGESFTAEDTDSTDAYFRRSMSLSPKIATDVEANDLSLWLLGIYKDPLLEFRNLTLNGRMDADNLWPVLLSYELGTRITVLRTPPGGGDRIERQCHIEGINHDISIKNRKWQWRTKWDLSTADPVGFWILDTSTLGETTRLAY